MDNVLISALSAVDVRDLSYSEWMNVGMALQHEGYPCSVWDEWSQNDQRSKELRRTLMGHLDGYAAFKSADRMQAHKNKLAEQRRIRREMDEEAQKHD